MGKFLEDNEAAKLKKLANKLKKGKTLNATQQEKYNYLTEKKAAGKKFGYSKDAKGLAAEMQAGEVAAQKGLEYGNVDVVGPYGSSKYEFDPVTGRFTQNINESGGQQQIRQQGEGLTQLGQQLAQQQLQGYKPYQMQDLSGERSRIEDEVFNRLTRTTDRDYQREKDQLEQTLHNRGIPLNPSDPNYQSHMQALNERYDGIKQNARAQATEMGGAEFQRSHGIGLGTHQQGMQDMTSLQQQGTGYQMANFAGPQGANFQMATPIGLATGKEGIAASQANTKNQAGMLGVTQQGVELQKQALAMQGQGHGQAAPAPSIYE